MEVIPAVDIMGGRVVRLSKGEPNTAETYAGFGDPTSVAKRWEGEGATRLHVIDLDAAIGSGNNWRSIASIVRGIEIPVQVGGGVRTKTVAQEMLTVGVERVVVGTLAFEKEGLLKTLLEEFGHDRIVVALDYLEGVVKTKGWKSTTGITLKDAMERFSNLGVELFLLTAISRDGLLRGPDYPTLETMVEWFNGNLIVAGGISSLNDLVRLRGLGVQSVIVGKALYEGRFSLNEAIGAVR